MKAVMLSIRPTWVELIFAGEKIFEIRKTRPRIDPPFKCFIYETKAPHDTLFEKSGIRRLYYGSGRVVGEFVCDAVFPLSIEVNSPSSLNPPIEFPGAAMTDADIHAYLGNGKTGYAWRISNLKRYGKPRELSDFIILRDAMYGRERIRELIPVRPPRSWEYVEDFLGESEHHATTD